MNIFKHVTLSKKQGDIGEARAIYEYSKLGYTVLLPLSDSNKYDLVIDDGKRLQRVQVKTSNQRPTKHRDESTGRCRYAVQISTSGGNTKIHTQKLRQNSDYDVLFVMVNTGQCWSIPMEELSAGHSIIVDLSDQCKYNKFKM